MEFKVKTRKLNRSVSQFSGSAKKISYARNTIEKVAGHLDIGVSTEKIKSTLLNASGKLVYLEAASSAFKRNLGLITQRYDLTETAIKNKQVKTGDPDSMRRAKEAHEKNNKTPGSSTRKGDDNANAKGGDPVNLDTGNFIYEKTDLKVGGAGGFSFGRFYNSMGANNNSMGSGWIHNYDISLHLGIDSIVIALEDGREEFFGRGINGFVSLSGSMAMLTKSGDGYIYETIVGDRYLFDGSGVFKRKEDNNGNGFSLEYSDGKLVKVIRDGGEYFAFEYSDADKEHIAGVSDHSGRSVTFSYEGNLLVGAVSGSRTYRYEYDSNGFLSAIINPRGIKIIHNEYDASGRATGQYFPDDSAISFRYDEDIEATVMTERNGAESYHFHDELYRNTENIYPNGSESNRFNENHQLIFHSDRNGNETHYTYDNKGNISKVLMANGTVVNFTYEKHNKPVTITVNGVRKQKNVYDDKGNLLESTDGLGRTTGYRYNEKGFLTLVRRPSGETVGFEYDDRNNTTAIIEENGARIAYEYDALNRVIRTVDGCGNSTSIAYDEHDNIVMVTNAAGAACSFAYNEIGKVTGKTGFDGASTTVSYNSLGKPDTITDPLGRVTKIGYDRMWNESIYIYPNGGTRHMEYDKNNNLTRMIDANGGITEYEYDGNGNVISVTDPEGAVTEMAYDELNNLSRVTDPEGNVTAYRYEDTRLTEITGANGAKTVLKYDDADQLIMETNALGESKEYMYTADGDIEMIIDGAGCVTSFEYAYKEHPSRICYPDGKEERFTYDANGNILTRSGKTGYTVEYVYDALGRVAEIRDSEGAAGSYVYDNCGRVISITDFSGNTTGYEYTLTGKLCAVEDALGNRTEYTYDEMDRLTGIDQLGGEETHSTRYERDPEGNVIRTIDPLGMIETYKYNGRGEIIERTDKDGYLTKCGFNGNGDMDSVIYADGREVMLSYDALRKLSEITDWTGRTTVESDILGRVIKVTYPDERSATYTYGKEGKRTSVTYPDGRVVKYTYDEGRRLTSLTEGETEIRYSFNAMGLLACKQFANGLISEYEYNDKGLLTRLMNSVKGQTVDEYSFTYDLMGNKTSVVKNRNDLPEDSGRFEYGYDALGRLETVSRDGDLVRRYSYDAFGNRTALDDQEGRTEYSYNLMNQLVSKKSPYGSIESFKYDKRGNLVERLNGNDVTHTYSYGAINRMEKAVSGIGSTDYEYNGLGHRIIEKSVPTDQESKVIKYTSDLTKQYNNLLERDVKGKTQSYLWGGGAAVMTVADINKAFYYAEDDLGSVIRLIDSEGSTAAAAGYDEFGIVTAEADGLFDIQPFGFTGYRTDSISGTYFAQAREYLPEAGRFTARDNETVISLIDSKSENLYVYCDSNPATYIDATGFNKVYRGLVPVEDGETVEYLNPVEWVKNGGDSAIAEYLIPEELKRITEGLLILERSGSIISKLKGIAGFADGTGAITFLSTVYSFRAMFENLGKNYMDGVPREKRISDFKVDLDIFLANSALSLVDAELKGVGALSILLAYYTDGGILIDGMTVREHMKKYPERYVDPYAPINLSKQQQKNKGCVVD